MEKNLYQPPPTEGSYALPPTTPLLPQAAVVFPPRMPLRVVLVAGAGRDLQIHQPKILRVPVLPVP